MHTYFALHSQPGWDSVTPMVPSTLYCTRILCLSYSLGEKEMMLGSRLPPPLELPALTAGGQASSGGGAAPGPAGGGSGDQKRLGEAWAGVSWSRMYCKMSISSMAWICCCFCSPSLASDGSTEVGTAGFLGSAGLAGTGGLGLG